jgi:FAD dependent oxidoreductase
MKVPVLGAGVIGVTTAWFLSKSGHEVTVVDRREAPGMETSFANGGQISVSHAEPWANPSAPLKLLTWLLREDAPPPRALADIVSGHEPEIELAFCARKALSKRSGRPRPATRVSPT